MVCERRGASTSQLVEPHGPRVRPAAEEGAAAAVALEPPLLLAAHLPPLAAQLPLLAGGLAAVFGGGAAAVADARRDTTRTTRFARLPCDSVTWKYYNRDTKNWAPAPMLSVRRVASPADGDLEVPHRLVLAANGAALRKEATRALLGEYEPVLTPLGTARTENLMCARARAAVPRARVRSPAARVRSPAARTKGRSR